MAYDVLRYPSGVWPDEAQDECPEALADLSVLIGVMREDGPSPAVYGPKHLGKNKGGLWQINLRVAKRQVRVLYAPYGTQIILFRIHKKGSPQEQERAYELAMKRKREYENARQQRGRDGSRAVH